jgi:hypothetical protein
LPSLRAPSQLFHAVDYDGSGGIDAGELKQLLTVDLHHGKQMTMQVFFASLFEMAATMVDTDRQLVAQCRLDGVAEGAPRTPAQLGAAAQRIAPHFTAFLQNVFDLVATPTHRIAEYKALYAIEEQPPGAGIDLGAASAASLLAAALTEIALCNVCSCQEILRRNGRGQGWCPCAAGRWGAASGASRTFASSRWARCLAA